MEIIIEYMGAHLDKIKSLFLLISFSILIRIVMQIFGQRWITTTAHTSTLIILPIVTFVITKVIAGNIALSLGMVGALSIVRFRNPVRSPLELSVYFISITMGIAASVNIKWLLFLIGGLLVALGVLILINYLSKNLLNIPFFTSSFSEGNKISTLELISKDEIKLLNKSDLLELKEFSNNEYKYILSSINIEKLEEIQIKICEENEIINYQLNR